MVNDDLLQQFKELLEENNKQLRQEVREDNKAEFDSLHDRLDAQREHINTLKTELTEKIDQQTHDVADILAKAVMPDIDRHDSEIKELQKAVGLRPKH